MIIEVTCPICHKRFIPAPQHVYKTQDKRRYICSYHCVLEGERLADERRAKMIEKRRLKNAGAK